MAIPEHKIDEVRDAADIVEVISNYVNLSRSGTVLRGLCPFHSEKTPSFSVNPQRRIFHCFGCGVGGNVFRFLMLHKGISFPEAVTELAERYGIDLPRTSAASGPRDKGRKTALYEAVEMAGKFFVEELYGPGGRRARDYLEDRGLGRDIIDEYRLGWAPPGWDNLAGFMESKRVPARVLEEAGLAKPRNTGRGVYDTFRARVICPIFDLDGKVVAFGGRLLEEEERQPKYLNSPETPIYRKGRLLYGLNRSRRHLQEKRTVLIVEGYFDYLSLAAHGVRHVAATLGTALTPDHLRLLKGYVRQAVLIFDADEAGRAAAARALPLFMAADLDGKVLSLPDGHDPDTFIRAYGGGALEEMAEKAGDLLDFYLTQTLAKHPDSLAGKSRAAQEVLGVVSRVEAGPRQDLLIRAAAERLGVSEEGLRRANKPRAANENDRRAPVSEVTPDFETETIRFVFLHPDYAEEVLTADLGPYFRDQGTRELYEALVGQYRVYGQVDVDRLIEELDPRQADLASGLAMSEDGLGGEDVWAAGRDFIFGFRQRAYRDRVAELSKKIKEAQEARDFSGLENLLIEKTRLLKEQKPESQGGFE